eukprot:scaffold935_cov334-Prasinococcus_capsulatus_cf.AAC.9
MACVALWSHGVGRRRGVSASMCAHLRLSRKSYVCMVGRTQPATSTPMLPASDIALASSPHHQRPDTPTGKATTSGATHAAHAQPGAVSPWRSASLFLSSAVPTALHRETNGQVHVAAGGAHLSLPGSSQ